MEERGDIKLDRNALLRGLKSARQPGRFEVFQRETLFITDGAHNEDGARALQETVNSLFKDKKILMIVGVLADKDVRKMADQFVKITDTFIVTEPESPRRLAAEKLANILENRGADCTVIKDYQQAFDEAEKRQGEFDVVIFAGSLYLIGKIRSMLKDE